MRKHLRTTAFIVLFAFVALPLSIDALTAENLPPHDSGCDCFECEIERAASVEPVYQHASDCPCNECVAKRESPSANNETSLEDVLDSWFGAPNPLYNPIKTTLDYLTERFDDFLSIPREYPYYEP